jgi:hypothetical protein
MLEQILHKEDHVPLFINEGGVDALLELVRWSITPAGKKFVAHATCLSSPSIGSVTHTNISTSFGSIVRTIASHSESNKITKKIMDALETQFTDLRKCIARFRDGVATGTAVMGAENEGEFSFSNILHSIPAGKLFRTTLSWSVRLPTRDFPIFSQPLQCLFMTWNRLIKTQSFLIHWHLYFDL